MKKKYLLGIMGIAVASLLASCGTESTTKDNATSTVTTTTTTATKTTTTTKKDSTTITTAQQEEASFSIERVYQDGETEDANSIVIDKETGVITINASGEYNVSGKLEGYITCLSTLESSVTINLIGAEITSGDHAAIEWTSENSKVVVKAKKDTENTLVSGSESTIWSENNIEIGGKGKLTITSGKHAISGSNVDVTSDITLVASAKKSAINAKAVTIEAGKLTLSGEENGILAKKNSKGKKGTVEITGGVILIQNSNKAISAEASISFTGDSAIEFDASNVTYVFDCLDVTSTATNFTYKMNGVVTDFE